MSCDAPRMGSRCVQRPMCRVVSGIGALAGLLRPKQTVDSVKDIDYEQLRERGISGLLFDLDNTLGPRRPCRLTPSVLALLQRLEVMGFRVGVLSNRRGVGDPVIDELAEQFPLLQRAGKPRRAGFRALLDELGVAPPHAAMIGDRYLTDVIGANRMGMLSIRVRRRPE